MNVFLIGGTGLLGSAAAAELIRRGHRVRSIALPPLPPGVELPAEMELELVDAQTLSDDQLRVRLAGCEAFVFAAGIDERYEAPPPIIERYRRNNVEPLKRLLPLAREAGVRRAVIYGSYFSSFDRKWPHLELARHHPYVQSRAEQQAVALAEATDRFSVKILELPYIFGVQRGRKPVWVFLVEMLRKMPGNRAYYPPGGTTMVTVRQVAEATAGAAETDSHQTLYPIGWTNLTWKELLGKMYRSMGEPDKKIVTVPKFLFRIQAGRIVRRKKAAGLDNGLDLPRFADVMCADAFIDKAEGSLPLGVTEDDIDAAIADSVKLSLDVLDKRTEVIDMKEGKTR